MITQSHSLSSKGGNVPVSPVDILPIELWEIIIDTLAFDPISTVYDLHTCALTQLTWLPRTRTHLFTTVCLNGQNYVKFRDLMRSNPLLGHLTSHCTLNNRSSSLLSPNPPNPPTCSITSLLLVCIKWLPNVKSLSLQFHNGLFGEHTALLKLLACLHNVRSLTITTKHAAPLYLLNRFPNRLRALETFDISGWNPTSLNSGYRQTVTRIFSYESHTHFKAFRFRIYDSISVPWMEWLLRSQYLTPETNELAIHWKRMSIDMHDIYQIIQEILIRCGASLTHLLLEYPRTFPAHDIMGISFRDNILLRDLCFRFPIAYLPMIVSNISTLPPHRISRLILQCSNEVLKHTPPSPKWARLDKLLAEGAAFASLTEVVFGSQDNPVDKERMVQIMPKLDGRNLLTLAVIGGWDWGRDASDFWIY